jgi:hypothetical protein
MRNSDDYRLVGNLYGARIATDYVLRVATEDMPEAPDGQHELPLDLFLLLGRHLVDLGNALIRRAAKVPAYPALVVEAPAWPS